MHANHDKTEETQYKLEWINVNVTVFHLSLRETCCTKMVSAHFFAKELLKVEEEESHGEKER